MCGWDSGGAGASSALGMSMLHEVAEPTIVIIICACIFILVVFLCGQFALDVAKDSAGRGDQRREPETEGDTIRATETNVPSLSYR